MSRTFFTTPQKPLTSIDVTRTTTILKPDQSRVLLRPFSPGDSQRISRIITRIMSLPEDRVGLLLEEVSAEFSQRHERINELFGERFEQLRELLVADANITCQRKLLIGSYFMAEYSLESAALFNPSIVPHPDQTNVPPNALRFVLSLRATGEGHISSITFRTGQINADNRIEIDKACGLLTEPDQTPNPQYEKLQFTRKLFELRITGEFARGVTENLSDLFTLEGLLISLETELAQSRVLNANLRGNEETAQGI